MAVNITNEELDLFNKNGFTDDDVRATVENYRSQGLDDNAIRAKVQAKLDSWSVPQEIKKEVAKPTTQPVEQTNVQPIKKQPLTEEEKQAEIARIKAEFEAKNKEIDREHAKKMAKLYGGAALEIGSAAIPFGAGLKLGSLALKASKPIAQQVIKNLATRGAIEGGLSGLVGGVGRGMVEDKDLKGIGLTALTDAGIGLVGGTSLGAIGGKVATNVGKTGQRIKNIEAKQLAKTKPQVTKEVKAEVVEQPQVAKQLDEVIPEQVVQATPEQVTGDIKKRSLQQSVLEAKGTPKEVKDIIKEDMPTYEVMHNKDLIAQATKELDGNFDNELVRLASAKDFDALDYEKSHQIARQLFGMGRYQQAVDLIDNVSENATKKGQAIQALSLWSNMTPEGAVYKAQKLLKEYNKKHPKKPINLTDENIKTIASLQEVALNTTDELAKNQALAKSAKYISELVPKNALQKLKAYRNISMLLNPKTLMRNTVGNVVFNAIDTASKGLASGIDTLMSLKTGQKTRVAPDLETYGKGLVEGAKTGYKEALQGIDTRGLGQRFDLGSGRTFKNKFMRGLETALDIGLRTPDRAFYEATFAESVQNMMKAQGLTKPTQEILEQAEQEALESVFQNKSRISDFAIGLRGGINRIGTKDFGLGDVLIPYAQTPANLTQQAINYSPLGAVKGIANWTQGNQRQASLDFARSLIGSGLIAGGYGLAKDGLTTPSQFDENYSKNKTIRENLQPLGIRPDQLGNMWYAPFQPMSSPIATGTAMYYGENPLYAGLNTVVDQPYLQGVTRGLRDLQEGDWASAGVNVLSSIPSQFVPTAFSQVAQTIDPYQRETYDPNKIMYGLKSAGAKIPFVSKKLPEKIDITGQPIERYSSEGAQKLFDIFVNPTFINKKTDDPVLSELKYIYDETKETSHFMPSVKKKLEFKDVDGNPQKITLTGKQLSEYQKRLGQRMYEEFDYVMDLPEYTNADEYGKIKLLENAKKLVKDEVDNEMWNKRKTYKKKSSYTKGN